MSSEDIRNKFGMSKKSGLKGGPVLVNKVVSKLGGGVEGLDRVTLSSLVSSNVEQIAGANQDKKYLLNAMHASSQGGSFRNKPTPGSEVEVISATSRQASQQERL